MTYRVRLRNTENESVNTIQNKITKGYRFIVYPFCISLILFSIHVISPAYFVGPSDYRKKQARRYNLLSLIFGWWSIPFGPSKTINSIKTNLKGGVDITEDIMLNLTEDSLKYKKLKVVELYTLFSPATKSTKRDFLDIIRKTKGVLDKEIYLARYINTEGFFYVLGFDSISEETKKELINNIRKVFHEHVHIEIWEIDKDEDVHLKLISQGEKIK